MREKLPRRSWKNSETAAPNKESRPEPDAEEETGHLELAKESLRELLHDRRIPDEVRSDLSDDYGQVETMLDKLEHGHIHIAVFGRVSVGKSAVLNALLGEPRFGVSALHGETTRAQLASWTEVESNGVFLIDTPGINEITGEDRERLAHEVAARSDLVLFVVDSDITDTEMNALRVLAQENRPLLLVLNKVDRYTRDDLSLIHANLAVHTQGLILPENIVHASALPAERIYIYVEENGREQEVRKRPEPNITALREQLWRILEQEGMTLSALNASLFAGRLSDQIAQRIIQVKRGLAEKVVRSYCVAKGVAVAINPIPVADLLAASVVDATMIVHLARVYGMDMNRNDAGKLIRTIVGQMTILMATVWGVHLVSSALKAGSAGLSTLLTGAAQGAVAYYSTYVIGRAAERYFAQGKSWGESGPKRVVQEILDSINRDSILEQARTDIFRRLKTSQ